MKVEKREFAWEFYQLSCLKWNCMIVDELLHGIFVEHVEQEQESHESWWESTDESLVKNFLNCHVLVKREQGLRELTRERVRKNFAELWRVAKIYIRMALVVVLHMCMNSVVEHPRSLDYSTKHMCIVYGRLQ